jgi:hypothetical protein
MTRTSAWPWFPVLLAVAGAAQALELPAVVYPPLPAQGGDGAAFVPSGWRLESERRGDLNGDAARQWLALYTTTDKTMGEPILADSIVAKTGENGGKQIPGNDYRPLTMFGSESIQNLVDETYSFEDDVDGIWMWYLKGKQAPALIEDTGDESESEESEGSAASGAGAGMTGSNIGGGITAIAIAGGGVVVIMACACVYFYRKRKATLLSEKDEQ